MNKFFESLSLNIDFEFATHSIIGKIGFIALAYSLVGATEILSLIGAGLGIIFISLGIILRIIQIKKTKDK